MRAEKCGSALARLAMIRPRQIARPPKQPITIHFFQDQTKLGPGDFEAGAYLKTVNVDIGVYKDMVTRMFASFNVESPQEAQPARPVTTTGIGVGTCVIHNSRGQHIGQFVSNPRAQQFHLEIEGIQDRSGIKGSISFSEMAFVDLNQVDVVVCFKVLRVVRDLFANSGSVRSRSDLPDEFTLFQTKLPLDSGFSFLEEFIEKLRDFK